MTENCSLCDAVLSVFDDGRIMDAKRQILRVIAEYDSSWNSNNSVTYSAFPLDAFKMVNNCHYRFREYIRSFIGYFRNLLFFEENFFLICFYIVYSCKYILTSCIFTGKYNCLSSIDSFWLIFLLYFKLHTNHML